MPCLSILLIEFTLMRAVDYFASFWNRVKDYAERGDVNAMLMESLGMMATTAMVAAMLDIPSIKVFGIGVDLEALRNAVMSFIASIFDIKVFMSVFLAVTVQKPLEYALKRIYRTELPRPGDALRWLSKNLMLEEEVREILRRNGYAEQYVDKYIKSIYREPSFREVFTAYKRGKISESEYMAWLSILNIDVAETLAGRLYPYKVMEEAAYTTPSPFLIASAIETGEVPEEVIEKILDYELVHPEFKDVFVKALEWRALRDERSLLRRYVIDQFSEGLLKPEEFTSYLGVLGVREDFAKQILDVALTTREKKLRSKAVSYYEKMYLEGRISRDEFVNMLTQLGYEDDFARKYASLLEYVRDNYYVFTLTKDERSNLASIYIEKYRYGMLTEDELRRKLAELAFADWEVDLKKLIAEEEYDMQVRKDRLNLLIEQMKQGLIDRRSFVENCAQLGFVYDKCRELADYYYTKYIGVDFYVATKDERKALANVLIKKYVDGWIDEDTLRDRLRKLRFLDAEIDLMIEKAREEYESKYLSDLLAEADALLKKQEIDVDEYIEYLASLGMARERAEARARRILASLKPKK